MTYNNHNREN